MTRTEAAQFAQVTNLKLYIVTMQSGPDLSKELIFGADMDDATQAAEMRFDGNVVNIRRAASHP